MPSDNDQPMRRTGNTRLTAPIVASVAAAMLLLAGAPAVADNINGTSGRDRLFGTAGSDEIRGLRGSDYMVGRPGSEVLYGRPGGDRVNDGSGDDRVLLGSGADFVSLQRGGDDVHAGPGDDSIQLRVDGCRDRIYCGEGRNDIARYIYRLDPRDQYFNCETIEEYSP